MKNSSDITLSIQSGGMSAFEKTGVYPEFLIFKSKILRRTWRLKLKKKTQKGFLKMSGQVFFNYFFDDYGCKIQELVNGEVVFEWQIKQILISMID